MVVGDMVCITSRLGINNVIIQYGKIAKNNSNTDNVTLPLTYQNYIIYYDSACYTTLGTFNYFCSMENCKLNSFTVKKSGVAMEGFINAADTSDTQWITIGC